MGLSSGPSVAIQIREGEQNYSTYFLYPSSIIISKFGSVEIANYDIIMNFQLIKYDPEKLYAN